MAAKRDLVMMFIVCLLLKDYVVTHAIPASATGYSATGDVTSSGVNSGHVYNASGAAVASRVSFVSYNETYATGEQNQQANFSQARDDVGSSNTNINNRTTNTADTIEFQPVVAASDVQFRLFTRTHPVLAEDMSLTVEDTQETVELDKTVTTTQETVIEKLYKTAHSQEAVKLDKTATTTQETVIEMLYKTADSQEAVVEWLDNFSTGKKIVVLTHGFRGSGDGEMCTQLRDAFLYTGDVNVIVVHWEKLARLTPLTSYEEAVTNTRHVAELVARLLDHIVGQSASTLADVHLVGYSLGAHVMGQAGRLLRTPGKVARITGLDPAKPSFETKPLSERLDASDALFVDVVHSETRSFGFRRRVGHVDVYPNGGEPPQPACRDDTDQDICDHRMSWRYYAAAVYHPQLCVAQRCDSWEEYVNATASNTTCPWGETAMMGPQMDTRTRGMFFLRTLSVSPYCVAGVHVDGNTAFKNNGNTAFENNGNTALTNNGNAASHNISWRSWIIEYVSLHRSNHNGNTAYSNVKLDNQSGNTAYKDNSGNSASSSASKTNYDICVSLLLSHVICGYALYRRFCCEAPFDAMTVALIACAIAMDVYGFYLMNEGKVVRSTTATEQVKLFIIEFFNRTNQLL